MLTTENTLKDLDNNVAYVNKRAEDLREDSKPSVDNKFLGHSFSPEERHKKGKAIYDKLTAWPDPAKAIYAHPALRKKLYSGSLEGEQPRKKQREDNDQQAVKKSVPSTKPPRTSPRSK